MEEFEREAEQINAPQLETMQRCSILLADMTVRARAPRMPRLLVRVGSLPR